MVAFDSSLDHYFDSPPAVPPAVPATLHGRDREERWSALEDAPLPSLAGTPWQDSVGSDRSMHENGGGRESLVIAYGQRAKSVGPDVRPATVGAPQRLPVSTGEAEGWGGRQMEAGCGQEVALWQSPLGGGRGGGGWVVVTGHDGRLQQVDLGDDGIAFC